MRNIQAPGIVREEPSRTLDSERRTFRHHEQSKLTDKNLYFSGDNLLTVPYWHHRQSCEMNIPTHCQIPKICWFNWNLSSVNRKWKNVSWSDESLLWKMVRIWREHHEMMDPSCLLSTVQTAGGVTVWRVSSWKLVPSVPTVHRLDVTTYLSVVADHVRPFVTTVDHLPMETSSRITCHKNGIIFNWFYECDTEFTELKSPPQSPDLKPIDHLWNVVELEVLIKRGFSQVAPMCIWWRWGGGLLIHNNILLTAHDRICYRSWTLKVLYVRAVVQVLLNILKCNYRSERTSVIRRFKVKIWFV